MVVNCEQVIRTVARRTGRAFSHFRIGRGHRAYRHPLIRHVTTPMTACHDTDAPFRSRPEAPGPGAAGPLAKAAAATAAAATGAGLGYAALAPPAMPGPGSGAALPASASRASLAVPGLGPGFLSIPALAQAAPLPTSPAPTNVPEPASVLIMATALVVVAVIQSRRRRE